MKRGRPKRRGLRLTSSADLGNGLRAETYRITLPKDAQVRALMEKAAAAAEAGDGAVAADLAYQVWRRGTGNAFVNVWSAQLIARFGDPARAVEIFCRAEDLADGDWAGYWTLGRYLAGKGEGGRDEVFLREAVQREPNAVDPARCLRAQGRGTEAKAHEKRVWELGGGGWLHRVWAAVTGS